MAGRKWQFRMMRTLYSRDVDVKRGNTYRYWCVKTEEDLRGYFNLYKSDHDGVSVWRYNKNTGPTYGEGDYVDVTLYGRKK